VVNGLINARQICEQVKAGESPYTAIEVMACPGGCVNGGGKPYADWNKRVGVVPFLNRIRTLFDSLIEPGETT
jgi:iron only hydrogenase large subunit-like protein